MEKCLICSLSSATLAPGEGGNAQACSCPACGSFQASSDVLSDVRSLSEDELSRLQAATRRNSDTRRYLHITRASLRAIIDSQPRRVTPMDSSDRMVILLGETISSLNGLRNIRTSNDFPLVGALDRLEFDRLISIMTNDLRLVERSGHTGDSLDLRLTPIGWAKYNELARFKANPDQAFV